MLLSLIAAMDRNGLIGAGDNLPWRLPRDLRRFRALTMGKPVIVGRRTHEAIGVLPGRHHIVLTRRKEELKSGCEKAANLDEAIRLARELETASINEVFVIGGGEVYREALLRCDQVYLTIVDGVFAGDVYFPLEGLREGWSIVEEEHCPADEKNAHAHHYFKLERGTTQPFQALEQ